MISVVEMSRALGPDQPVQDLGVVREGFASREEAEDYCKQFAQRFELNGYNEEQGYWWFRNRGELQTGMVLIR